MKPLHFHSAVQIEFEEAALRYQQARPGLGGEFLDELERVTAIVQRDPLRGSKYNAAPFDSDC